MRFTNSSYSDHKKEKIIIRIKNINFLWHLIVKADHHWETKRGQCHHFIMIYFSLAEMKMIWFLELVMEFPFSCYPYAGKRNLIITKQSMSSSYNNVLLTTSGKNYMEREVFIRGGGAY